MLVGTSWSEPHVNCTYMYDKNHCTFMYVCIYTCIIMCMWVHVHVCVYVCSDTSSTCFSRMSLAWLHRVRVHLWDNATRSLTCTMHTKQFNKQTLATMVSSEIGHQQRSIRDCVISMKSNWDSRREKKELCKWNSPNSKDGTGRTTH